jgi:hypothetical protein
MRKEILLILTLLLILILSFTVGVSAEHRNKKITPYGDFCNRVSHYGTHKHMLSNNQIKESLKHYFGAKGLDFEIIHAEGRFVKAIIKDKDTIVDTIILDRQSGRIRSIY